MAQLSLSPKIYSAPTIFHMIVCNFFMFQNNHCSFLFNTRSLGIRNFKRLILFVYTIRQLNSVGKRVSSAKLK